MSKIIDNVLTDDFLCELFNSAITQDNACAAVSKNLEKSDMPDRDFIGLLSILKGYYFKYKSAPGYNILSQELSGNKNLVSLLSDIQERTDNTNTEAVINELQSYIVKVRFQNAFKKMGELYMKGEHPKALDILIKHADWYKDFSLNDSSFINVIDTFKTRFDANRKKHNETSDKKPITRFYITELDARNNATDGDKENDTISTTGRDLRTQLTCFLASTGVGKSHIARWVGKSACQDDGLNVLHIQLEGSEKEILDAYSASLVNCNSYRYETGTLTNESIEKSLQLLKVAEGSLMVKVFPKFNMQVSTVDIKNTITEYKKKFPANKLDIVIIDSMDLLTDASGKNWSENGERHKRVAVANDLKDLAADEDVWMVVTYQATIEKQDLLNDENYVLTEYNCSEAKGLSRPLTHLITLNQTKNERADQTMRINIAKSRFFPKGEPFSIATNYANEQFFDKERTMRLTLRK